MNKIRQKGLVVFLLCLPVLHFLFQKWIPYYRDYEKINQYYYYLDWEKQIIFLVLSLIFVLFIVIAISSLLAVILNRHHCNIEFHVFTGSLLGLFFGVGIMLMCVMFDNDIAGLQSIMITLLSGILLGLIVGIKNEIENDERVC